MEYFLPIAEVYVNLPLIFILSLVVGVLSGLFGVGGGFLMTPFLIFLGVPPAYAVPVSYTHLTLPTIYSV